MKEIILDTSFIISCVRQKIDFFKEISLEGMKIFIPKQTISELKGLDARLALNLVDANKEKFEVLTIPGKDADEAIIRFARKNPRVIVATLDQGLKKKLKNRKMVIRMKKKLEIF